MMENKEHIDAIIKNTFDTLRRCYDNQEKNNKEFAFRGSRLIFPMKRDGSTRISEQELRFVFVEVFNKYCCLYNLDWFYSVETPTMDTYKFKGEASPMVDDGGQSASFDMVIHDKTGKRIALIEFKALNPVEFEYKKDYLKLKADTKDSVLRYFVMVLRSHDSGTLDNVMKKLTEIENDIKEKVEVTFHCYSLEGDRGRGKGKGEGEGEILTCHFNKCDH